MIRIKKERFIGTALLVICDVLSVFLAIFLGFKLRFGIVGNLSKVYSNNMLYYMLIITLVAIMSNIILRCYSTLWRYFGYKDLLRQFVSGVLTGVFVALVDNFVGLELPLEMFILIPTLIFMFMTIVRFLPRAFKDVHIKKSKKEKDDTEIPKSIIIGAGEAGNYLITNLNNNSNHPTSPICFLDDNENLWNRKIGGVPIIGGLSLLEYALDEYKPNEIIIAIPSASTDLIRSIYRRARSHRVEVKRYGSMNDVTVDDFRRASIKELNFEELLGRSSISLDKKITRDFIEGKVVAVTGGVGSIGSEICRQVLAMGCKLLLIIDINENGLFYIRNEFEEAGYSGRFRTVLGSVRDRKRLNELFVKFKPAVVFHAAAHKHVPMMEMNPKEAIKNNVLGTINVANAAIFCDVEKFILISTDKAVNPTNIMGASKRIAEIAIQTMNKIGKTDFAAVRFGNVLGSNGSVVPYFEKQIESGGPVTVTHREMKRYFMTIPEAVQLVLEAGAMAIGGEIFVLDMGEPVYIYDLACDLIRHHGLEPGKDINIEITGLRPGEKLFEEISLAEEDTTKTENNLIYINKPIDYNEMDFSRSIKRLEEIVKTDDLNAMFSTVKEIVGTFDHKNTDEVN